MSQQKSIFLEADPSIAENNLRFVRDEAEEEFNSMFAPIMNQAQDISSGRSKIVKPLPGFCVKAFKKGTKDKFFINLCQTDGIPAPEDITEDKLMAILNHGSPDNFKIPMSISQPRPMRDHSDKPCQVCDIAVNDKFFKKIESGGLLHDFLLSIIFEGIEAKYKIVLQETNWIVLKNKRFVDKLIPHNIQNSDAKAVYESYEKPTLESLQKIQELDNPPAPGASRPKKKLIEEIDPVTLKTMKNAKNTQSGQEEYTPDKTKLAISQAASKIPDYRLFREPAAGKAKVMFGEFYLPGCTTAKEIALDIGEDRILLEARKKGYLLDAFVDYKIDGDRVQAQFNVETKMLNVIMPLSAA